MLRHPQAILTVLLTWLMFQPSSLAQSALSSKPLDQLAPRQFARSEASALQDHVPLVHQLAEVRSTDWAFQALQSLVNRSGCISDGSIARGNQTLSRYEFAAKLNSCLTSFVSSVRTSQRSIASPIVSEDLQTLRRLQTEFTAELARLHPDMEVRADTLEKQQFSTTTKLQGIVVMAANAGSFSGNRIVDINGNPIAESQPRATVLYRASLVLDTSFTGTDLLRILVEAGSEGISDNTAGYLEPTFGSVLDYSAKPPTGNTLGLDRVFYTFKPLQDLEISAGPIMTLTDFVDLNQYANLSFRDFSTLAFVNNYILFPLNGLGAGGVAKWRPDNGAFTLSAGYIAAEAQNPSNQGPVRAVNAITSVLYPNSRGRSGLFGDTYQSVVELEYAPSKALAVRLQYAGGQVLNNGFNAIGANLEWSPSPRIGIFGRYGYSWYSKTAFGTLNPQYWMAGIVVKDVFKPGASVGLAAGQPFIETRTGTGTQTNFEAFYSFPVNDNVQISPVVQIITTPANQATNGTIFTGTLRTVFRF